jgi:hypothetical protein
MTKYYILSRKIHRYLVIIITVLTVIMAGTGTVLKFPVAFGSFGFINVGLVRFIHNNLSILFTIVLLLMAISGIIMYLFPYLNKKK